MPAPAHRIGFPRAFIAALQIARGGSAGRPAYLLLTVAMTVAAWFALSALASPFISVRHDVDSDNIRVENARNPQQWLPVKYAARLAAMPGVRHITYFDLQLLACGDVMVTVNAVGGTDPDSYIASGGWDSQAANAWREDPVGLLISPEAAKACGWRAGQGIEPMTAFGHPAAFHVVAVSDKEGNGPFAFAHYDYINRGQSVAKTGNVMAFFVEAQRPADNETLAARIDAEFAHDDPPVTAYPDTAREDARSRLGKVQYLIALVATALFLSCLLVLASVMAHAAAERRAKLGMLRVLGFPRRVLVAGYVIEVVGIVCLGAMLGIALGQVLLHYLPIWLRGQMLRVAPAPWAWMWLPSWLLLLAVLALLRPASLALRARPLDCRED